MEFKNVFTQKAYEILLPYYRSDKGASIIIETDYRFKTVDNEGKELNFTPWGIEGNAFISACMFLTYQNAVSYLEAAYNYQKTMNPES